MFFEQKFKIFYDSGKIIEVYDLYSFVYLKEREFYYSMKFTTKLDDKPYISWSNYIDRELRFSTKNFFLYTENNIMISPDLFLSEYNKLYRKNFIKRWNTLNKKIKHKYSKSHTTTINKRMRTMQSNRASCLVVKEDGEPEFRGRRRKLTTFWDDVQTRRSTSWKNSTKRKKQYKGN